jgi:hypothetical protein
MRVGALVTCFMPATSFCFVLIKWPLPRAEHRGLVTQTNKWTVNENGVCNKLYHPLTRLLPKIQPINPPPKNRQSSTNSLLLPQVINQYQFCFQISNEWFDNLVSSAAAARIVTMEETLTAYLKKRRKRNIMTFGCFLKKLSRVSNTFFFSIYFVYK